MSYMDHGVLEFPIGTLIVKTFAYPIDGRASAFLRRVYSSLVSMVGMASSYKWKRRAEAEAHLVLGGSQTSGLNPTHTYEIPNANQCLSCHEQNGVFQPLGPTAGNLNRGGQLENWASMGVFERYASNFKCPNTSGLE